MYFIAKSLLPGVNGTIENILYLSLLKAISLSLLFLIGLNGLQHAVMKYEHVYLVYCYIISEYPRQPRQFRIRFRTRKQALTRRWSGCVPEFHAGSVFSGLRCPVFSGPHRTGTLVEEQ